MTINLCDWLNESMEEAFEHVCERHLAALQDLDSESLCHNLPEFIERVDEHVVDVMQEHMDGTFLGIPKRDELLRQVTMYRVEHDETNTLVYMTGVFCIQGGPKPSYSNIVDTLDFLKKQDF